MDCRSYQLGTEICQDKGQDKGQQKTKNKKEKEDCPSQNPKPCIHNPFSFAFKNDELLFSKQSAILLSPSFYKICLVLCFKTISYSPNRLNVLRVGGVFFHLLTNLLDMDCHSGNIPHRGKTPYLLK